MRASRRSAASPSLLASGLTASSRPAISSVGARIAATSAATDAGHGFARAGVPFGGLAGQQLADEADDLGLGGERVRRDAALDHGLDDRVDAFGTHLGDAIADGLPTRLGRRPIDADENELGDALRLRDGEVLQDQRAERMADEAGALDVLRIEQRDQILHPAVDGELARERRPAHAFEVVAHDAEAIGERARLRLPHVGGAAEAVQEDDRVARPLPFDRHRLAPALALASSRLRSDQRGTPLARRDLVLPRFQPASSHDHAPTSRFRRRPPRRRRPSSRAVAAEKVELALNWVAGGDHAPLYYAKKMGWYSKAGIDLDLQAGKGSVGAIQRVSVGGAQLGLADMAVVLTSVGKGANVTAVFDIYANTALGMYWLKSSGIASVKDFAGKRIGVPAGDAQRALWPALAKLNGVEPDFGDLGQHRSQRQARCAALEGRSTSRPTSTTCTR